MPVYFDLFLPIVFFASWFLFVLVFRYLGFGICCFWVWRLWVLLFSGLPDWLGNLHFLSSDLLCCAFMFMICGCDFVGLFLDLGFTVWWFLCNLGLGGSRFEFVGFGIIDFWICYFSGFAGSCFDGLPWQLAFFRVLWGWHNTAFCAFRVFFAGVCDSDLCGAGCFVCGLWFVISTWCISDLRVLAYLFLDLSISGCVSFRLTSSWVLSF